MQVASKPSHRYQVPRKSGCAFVEPALAGAIESRSDWITEQAAGSPIELCGLSLETVRSEARLEAIGLAQRYTRAYRDIETLPHDFLENAPLLLAGHQPELFHPGVWFKNYLLAESANRFRCIALNFVVDNDLCRTTAVRVPTRGAAATGRLGNDSLESARNSARTNAAVGQHAVGDGPVSLETVAWDRPREAIPWECRLLCDVELFESFPTRVRQALLPEIERPIVDRLWHHARQAIQRTRIVGAALAQARHALEGELGMNNLELPLSQLTSTRSFARFSLQLLNELPRFQQIYNAQRDKYRRLNRIRSEAHPVPALAQSHGWLEAPWWIYRAEAPKRQRLFARWQDDALLLSDQCGWNAAIEGPLDCENAVDQWMELLLDDTFLRPRALLTTMYTRMIVGDLFVHGIGGGKYDELTDAILSEFFGCDAPPFVVASATLHLPVNVPAATDEDLRAEQAHDWQLKFHAEQFIDSQQTEAARLIEQKQFLLKNIPPKRHKWEWHREITAVNRRLSELASAQMIATSAGMASLADKLRERRLLESREVSFCLFPLAWLDAQLKSLGPARK